MRRIGIVGAGMAGLACAESLAAMGYEVLLFDKARGPGGRMSTRRLPTPLGEVTFDHGAQYFTVRDPDFGARVDAWVRAGCVAAWPVAGPGSYVGVPGMNAPIRAMADLLEVHWASRVTALSSSGAGWLLSLDSAAPVEVDGVVLALPAEQSDELLRTATFAWPERVRHPPTAPCWTVMLAFDTAIDTPRDCLREPDDAILSWAARNNSKPGRPAVEAWVLQAGPRWSGQFLEASESFVVQALTEALAARLGVTLPAPIASSAHRWRYARSGSDGSVALWEADRRIGLCGDWLIGARVEAAWLSGTALARRIGAPPRTAS